MSRAPVLVQHESPTAGGRAGHGIHARVGRRRCAQGQLPHLDSSRLHGRSSSDTTSATPFQELLQRVEVSRHSTRSRELPLHTDSQPPCGDEGAAEAARRPPSAVGGLLDPGTLHMDRHHAPAEQYRPRGLLAPAAGVATHPDPIRHSATSNAIQPPRTAPSHQRQLHRHRPPPAMAPRPRSHLGFPDLHWTAAPHSSPWLPEDYVQNFREAAQLEAPSCWSGAGR
jgi:hypothetical protein